MKKEDDASKGLKIPFLSSGVELEDEAMKFMEAKLCCWARLLFGEVIFFYLFVNNRSPNSFLLFIVFFFSVNSFETLGLKQTDCQLEKGIVSSKKGHCCIEK